MQLVESSLERFDLESYSESKAASLSGGNKRKLSTAIALLSNPRIVFLASGEEFYISF